MTPEEKANKIFAGLTTINEHFGYKFTQPLMNTIDNTALALKEAGPREVSENEVLKAAQEYEENCPHWNNSECAAASQGFQSGVEWAMRLNAMPKLESLWPSESEAAHQAYQICEKIPETVTQYAAKERATRNFFDWIKARVLGSEK